MLYNLLNSSLAVRMTRGWSKRLSFPLFYYVVPWKRPAFVLSFDVDFRRDVEALPEVCSMLEKAGIPASFACVGSWVVEFPREHRLLVEKGHEIVNHSMHHPDNQELDTRRWNDLPHHEQRQEIAQAHRVIQEICGVTPQGFRMPHFGPQHRYHLYHILRELGYLYSSSTTCGGDYRFCRPLKLRKEKLIEFPTATVPSMGYASFDSFNYFNKARPFSEQGRDMAEDFRNLLEKVKEEGLLGTLYFDPYDFVLRQEYQAIAEELGKSEKEIFLCRYKDCLCRIFSL